MLLLLPLLVVLVARNSATTFAAASVVPGNGNGNGLNTSHHFVGNNVNGDLAINAATGSKVLLHGIDIIAVLAENKAKIDQLRKEVDDAKRVIAASAVPVCPAGKLLRSSDKTCVSVTCATLHANGENSNDKTYVTDIALDGSTIVVTGADKDKQQLRNISCLLSLPTSTIYSELPTSTWPSFPQVPWELWTQFGSVGTMPSLGNKLYDPTLDVVLAPSHAPVERTAAFNRLMQPYGASLESSHTSSQAIPHINTIWISNTGENLRYCDHSVFSKAFSFHGANSYVAKARFQFPARFKHMLIKYGKCHSSTYPVTLYQNGRQIGAISTSVPLGGPKVVTRVDYLALTPGDTIELREEGAGNVASLYYVLLAE